MGLVKMSDIQVGDEVFGSDGWPTQVVGVFPQGVRPTYRVTFSDGSTLDCDDQHLWAVRTPTQKHRDEGFTLLTTEELRASPLVDGNGNRQRFIPMTAPLCYSTAPLPLDPYVLGVLLGDGLLSGLGVMWVKPDPWMADEIERIVGQEYGCVVHEVSRYGQCPSWRISYRSGVKNPVRSALGELGLLGSVSHTKFIPEGYFYGSVEQRLSLLQGLLDTDGHVRPADNNIEFSSASEELARGVSRLVQSLGGTAKVRVKKEPAYTYKGERRIGRPSYRMSLALPPIISTPFRTPVKADNYHVREKYQPSRSIVSIVSLGEQETVCIKVAAADGLFVAGTDYVVTHNTVITVCAVEELAETNKVDSGLVIVPASLKYQWAEKIREFTGDDNYVIIDGTPGERAKQYEKARQTRPRYIILNYEKVRDEWNEVTSLPRDYICADEATTFKSFQAKISKRIKRLHAPYFIGLTGQPIENRPEDLFSIMQAVDPTVLGRWDIFDKTFIVRDNFGRINRVKNLPLLWDLMEDAMSRKTRHDPDVAPFMPTVTETVIPVAFDTAGAKVYRRIVADLLEDLQAALAAGTGFDLFSHYTGDAGDDNTMRGQIMAKMTVLRMLCDHPDLVRLSAKFYDDPDTQAGAEYASDLAALGLLEPLKTAPKMKVLIDTLDEILAESDTNKVVVFSTFVPTLQIIADAMSKHVSVQFHGKMDAKQKDAAKQKFARDKWCRLFLSSDAGGYGVDLPNANYLINYDLPWSAGKWDQRNARIIRLSSEFDKVVLTNLTMRGSLEERQYDMLKEKRAVASAMVDRKGADVKGRFDLGLGTLTEFLQSTDV